MHFAKHTQHLSFGRSCRGGVGADLLAFLRSGYLKGNLLKELLQAKDEYKTQSCQVLGVLAADPCIGKVNKVNTRTVDKPYFLHPPFSLDSNACGWRWQVLQCRNCLSTCAEEVSLKLKNVQSIIIFTSNVDLMILGCSPLALYRNPYVVVYKCHSTYIIISRNQLCSVPALPIFRVVFMTSQ